jgi:Protein of unknown function (DUF541)
VRRLALAAVVVAAFFPGEALAQFAGPLPFQVPSEDYGPGITVTGAGFAPLGQRERATARAVGDARRRAEAIAAALDVAVGDVRTVEVTAPFEPRPECRRPESPRCSPLDAVSAEATFSIAGGPTSDEDARELTGIGVGQAAVEPARRTSPSIRRALRAGRLAATPAAAEAAAANARAAATAIGVPVGPLFSVVESASFYGYDPVLGTFGAGRFCGIVTRGIYRPDPETGRVRLVRRVRKRRCFNPRSATVRLEVTYLGG